MLIVLQISRNRGTGGNEEKKCYEDKEIFNAQKEVSEYDQVGASYIKVTQNSFQNLHFDGLL